MILFEIILIIVVVGLVALFINGVEDYSKNTLKIPFVFYEDINLPIIKVNDGQKDLYFLVDTGSATSVIDSTKVENIKHIKLKATGTIYGAEGNVVDTEYVSATLFYDNKTFVDAFQVVRIPGLDNLETSHGIVFSGIIGNTLLSKYNLKIDYFSKSIYYDKKIK